MKRTISLFLGIAVGVCIGLLVAPAKGSETRQKLADSAGDWTEKFKDLFSGSDNKNRRRSGSKTARRTVSRKRPKPRSAG